MALTLPESAAELANRSKTDVQRELQGSDPFAKNHWLLALITAFSNRIFDFYLQLLEAIDQNLPDTATGIFLSRWLAIFRITGLIATSSTGNVVASGTNGSSINIGTTFSNSAGLVYTSTSTVAIAIVVQAVDTLTRSGTVVTVKFITSPSLASGLTTIIASSTTTEFNGTFSNIIVISDTEYTFNLTVAAGGDDLGGTATSTSTFASVPIESDDTGSAVNLDNGETVTLNSPIAGVDNILTADAGAVGGGTDTETEASTRNRLLERIQNPVAHYNSADIETLARTVNGVTRVFVQTPSSATTAVIVNLERVSVDGSATNIAGFATIASGVFSFTSGQSVEVTNSSAGEYNTSSAIGTIITSTTLTYPLDLSTAVDPAGNQATITGSDVPLGVTRVFFMRDNDVDAFGNPAPFPTAAEVLVVKTLLDTILPANTSTNDLVVAAPTANAVDFAFASIIPDSDNMRTAISESLEDMMLLRTSVGLGIDEDIYRAAITNTFNEVDAIFLESFDLTSPTGDITGATGVLPTLGDVTFA